MLKQVMQEQFNDEHSALRRRAKEQILKNSIRKTFNKNRKTHHTEE